MEEDKNLRSEWEKALSIHLQEVDCVCELHFRSKDIDTSYETKMPDGTIHRIPKSRVTLKPNAVPIKSEATPTIESLHSVAQENATESNEIVEERNKNGFLFPQDFDLIHPEQNVTKVMQNDVNLEILAKSMDIEEDKENSPLIETAATPIIEGLHSVAQENATESIEIVEERN